MSGPLIALQVTLALFLIGYIVAWIKLGRPQDTGDAGVPKVGEIAIGAGTNFFDTLGIGSFAPTTALFRMFRIVPDERIPGTLNIGHTLPTIVQAFYFTTVVE